MTTAVERSPMAKAKGRPKRSGRNDRTAKIDATILGWAEMVARARGVTLAEYLSETLRSPVARDFTRVMEQMKGEAQG